jgi:hypothetical protein
VNALFLPTEPFGFSSLKEAALPSGMDNGIPADSNPIVSLHLLKVLVQASKN